MKKTFFIFLITTTFAGLYGAGINEPQVPNSGTPTSAAESSSGTATTATITSIAKKMSAEEGMVGLMRCFAKKTGDGDGIWPSFSIWSARFNMRFLHSH